MRRSAGILNWSHYVYLTRNLKHWKDLNFKTYKRQNRGLPLRWEVHHFKHPYHSYNRSHSIGGLGGIFDNVASSSDGSLLVDILIIMPSWDAIMHSVSCSAVIYGQPVLCYRTTPGDE